MTHQFRGAIARRHRACAPVSAIIALLLAGQASAQTAPDASIVVTGYRYLDQDTGGITGLPLTVAQVPQSITLINNDFAKAADLKNLGAIAQQTTGALWASFSPSYGNQIWLRGFSANFAIDGLPVGDQITEPDAAILNRYEVVKGPASVVYGAQSPGGIVNLVSKSATPGTPSYLEALGGSWGRWRLEGQLAGALTADGSIRAIAVAAHEEGGSFVDFVKQDRTVVYGGLDFVPAGDVTGYLRASWQRTSDTPYNGIPTYADGSLVDVPRSYFLGASDARAVANALRFDAGLTWKPGALWSFDLKAVYQHTTHGGENAYPYSTIAADGSFPTGGEVFSDWHVEDFNIAASATRKLDDVGLKDSTITASLRYQHYRYTIDELGLTGGTANLFDGDAAVAAFFNAETAVPSSGYEQDQRMNYLTASSQAVIKPIAPLTLVGGIAWSSPRIAEQVYGGAFTSYNPGDQVNYRAAAIVEPVHGLNLYASYGESYQPNLRIDTSLHVLAPVQGKQYEVGAKYSPVKALLLTAALFDIEEKNVAVYDSLVNGESLYRAENVRHRGLELEASGQLTRRWQIKAGLALLDAKVVLDPENPVNDGETRPWLPKTTANLFTTYDIGHGVALSAGGRYVGQVGTYDRSQAPTLPIAAYTLVDAAASYTTGPWRFQLNVKNIGDKRYYVATPIFASLAGGLYPGEPRSFTVSVQRNFR
jgi:TonB-dependent siderophore receptor